MGGDVAPISWGSPFNGGDIALLSTGSSRCLRKEASSLGIIFVLQEPLMIESHSHFPQGKSLFDRGDLPFALRKVSCLLREAHLVTQEGPLMASALVSLLSAYPPPPA